MFPSPSKLVRQSSRVAYLLKSVSGLGRLLYSTISVLQGKCHLYIPFLKIARPQSQFPHSCVCERFIYSQDRSIYFLQQNWQIGRGNIYINCSHTHECGNWDCGRAIPFLRIFVSNFRYWFFALWDDLLYRTFCYIVFLIIEIWLRGNLKICNVMITSFN